MWLQFVETSRASSCTARCQNAVNVFLMCRTQYHTESIIPVADHGSGDVVGVHLQQRWHRRRCDCRKCTPVRVCCMSVLQQIGVVCIVLHVHTSVPLKIRSVSRLTSRYGTGTGSSLQQAVLIVDLACATGSLASNMVYS